LREAKRLADPGVPRMPHAALEVSVDAPFGALRIASTHLAYYPSVQCADPVELKF
jgi:endonuclease/exonuclease/phosphatase family metal-dependent hydrolase